MELRKVLKQLRELEKLGKKKEMRLAAEEWDEEWKTLIATIMSAQSRDETTIPIASKLFDRYKSIEELARAKYKNVLKIFSGLNYNKTKAKNVINCAKELVGRHNSKVPHDFDQLVELSGVGRKTANVFLTEYGSDAIGVDTHLSYISQKLGWTSHKNPHKIEQDLLKLFPRKRWKFINQIAVRFGKSHTKRKEKDKLLEDIKKIK